jgi:hypothetical protein
MPTISAAADRSRRGVAGLTRLLRPADLCHRPLPLTLASMLGSAAGFLVLALPLSLPTMYVVLVLWASPWASHPR